MGDQKLKAQVTEFNKKKRITATDSIAELFAVQWAESVGSESQVDALEGELPQDMTALLRSYAIVFDIPRGLPPQRSFDHRIVVPDHVPP